MSRRIFWVSVAVVAVLGSGVVGISDASGFWRGGFGYGPPPPPRTTINWKVAGTIVNVQLAIPTSEGPFLQPAFLIQAVMKGSPGDAQFTFVGIPDGFPGLLDQCGGGPGQLFSPNDMVITFSDLSMLFAHLSSAGGWVCFQEDGTVTAVANMEVIGGTGRFENAAGEFVGVFQGNTVGTSGALSAETGTIEGWIER